MAEDTSIIKTANIVCEAGIFRDWTSNSSTGWTDGQYTRFLEGRPKKVGGWKLLASLGLSTNNTPYLKHYYTYYENNALTSSEFVEVGTVRLVKTYNVDSRYVMIVAADINNAPLASTGSFAPISPTDTTSPRQVIPSGLWIGVTDDFFNAEIVLHPISFSPYPLFDPETGDVVRYQYFQPGAFNWTVAIYGVTSGGYAAAFTPDDPTGGGGAMSSLAIVAHAAQTIQDKNSTYNNYVFFGLLSNLLDFNAEQNYALDPLTASTNYEVSADKPKRDKPEYIFNPQMYPMTQKPFRGTVSDPNNVYVLPEPVDPFAIYCTDEVIVSGGVEAVGPFLFAYGNNGLIRNCTPNTPNYWANAANKYYQYQIGLANDNNIDNYKMLAMKTVRSGAGLSALAWTTNSLWLVSFTGDTNAVFSYTNISNTVSLISGNSIIENAGIYYWVGEDKFYMYNGSLVSLPNHVNFNWFYENLNYNARTQMFAFKNPHYNEIWWVFPKGDSNICNHAIVFNYQENLWYDTPWERTAGFYDQSYYHPFCAGKDVNQPVLLNDALTYKSYQGVSWANLAPASVKAQAIWIHEIGNNEVTNDTITAINSYITSCDIGLLNGGPASTKNNPQGVYSYTVLDKILPDAIGRGEQYIQVSTKDYPMQPMETKYTLRWQVGDSVYQSVSYGGRMVFVTFGCDSVDSTFFLGKPVVLTQVGAAQ